MTEIFRNRKGQLDTYKVDELTSNTDLLSTIETLNDKFETLKNKLNNALVDKTDLEEAIYNWGNKITDAVGTPCDGYFTKTTTKPTVASIKTVSSPAPLHISLVHNCANCGAQLEIEENKPVFHCKYCGSTYVIGPAQIYSHY